MANATILITASVGKHEICRQLGANFTIDYKSEDFAAKVKEYAEGVDVVIDFIGAPYLQKNLDVLRPDGRLVQLAMMGGAKVEALSMVPILRKRLKIMGSTLRARSLDYKIRLTRDFRLLAEEALATGVLKPVVDKIFDWQEVAEAHRYMEANKNQGKIVLTIG